MLRRISKAGLGCVATGYLLLCAWDGTLPNLGLTQANNMTAAKRALIEDNGAAPNAWPLSSALKKAWQDKPAAERAQQARDLALFAKDFVSTPAFETAYNQWIKDRFSAVNHGLKVTAPANAQMSLEPASIDKMQREAAVTMAKTFLALPPASLEPSFQDDLRSWGEGTDAKDKQLASRAKALQPLVKSNPEEFRKQYAVLKSFEMGGPSTVEAFDRAAAGVDQSQANAKQMEEQKAFNEHQLKAQLKVRLQAFVKLARQVDYAAETKTVNSRRIFVNPAYERQTDDWKRLYRVGKEPAMAAAGVAEQWLKEL